MNKIKLSLVLLFSNVIYAGNGGNVAAGVIGGLGAGALLATAVSKPRTREVVYVESERPARSSRKERELREWENDLRQWDRELKDLDADLREKERELERRECALNTKERRLKTRTSPLKAAKEVIE